MVNIPKDQEQIDQIDEQISVLLEQVGRLKKTGRQTHQSQINRINEVVRELRSSKRWHIRSRERYKQLAESEGYNEQSEIHLVGIR